MTTDEKVELVAAVWETHGLAPALAAVELLKSTWYYHRRHKVSYEEKYAHVRPLLEKIACEHPAYGIPRITAELPDTYDQVINHKVVQRPLPSWDLALLRSVRVRLSYALNGAKDNPEMESFIGRFKTEGHSLFLDAHDIAELRTVVAERMRYYNAERRHSSIGYLPPLAYIERVLSGFAERALA